MATVYTSQDYLNGATKCRAAINSGTHLTGTDIVFIILLLEDASTNVAGISPIQSSVVADGTPPDATTYVGS